MTPLNPATALRLRLIAALETEFSAESIEFGSDKLNDSLGQEGAIGAVYPATDAERPQDVHTLETTVYVQLFDEWTAKVDPKMVVDPTQIEEWAERVRRSCQEDSLGPNDAHLWWYRVVRIDYPDDPTGNKSRLLATVVGTAQNPATIPTTD